MAQRVRPGFVMQGQEGVIATICRQVEGMPLALELAASWVRVMSCAEIARQVQTDLDFLSTPLRNLPERHRNMRARLEQSWRLLSPAEQRVFMRLSVFQGGWQLAEATAMTGATLTILLNLVDQSLVRVDESDRFAILARTHLGQFYFHARAIRGAIDHFLRHFVSQINRSGRISGGEMIPINN